MLSTDSTSIELPGVHQAALEHQLANRPAGPDRLLRDFRGLCVAEYGLSAVATAVLRSSSSRQRAASASMPSTQRVRSTFIDSRRIVDM